MTALVWAPRTNPFDSNAYHGVWADSLSLFIVAGQDSGLTVALATSPDGVTWTPTVNNPFGDSGNGVAVAWSPELPLAVAVGGNGLFTDVVATSTDGVNWTSQGNPTGIASPFPTAIAWSGDLGLFLLMGIDGDTGDLFTCTSPDGVVWTPQTTGWESGGAASDITWSPTVGLFVVAGTFPGPAAVLISPDGVSWDSPSTPFDGEQAQAAYWSANDSLFYVGVGSVGYTLMSSPDAIAWTAILTPFDNLINFGAVSAVVDGPDGRVVIGGYEAASGAGAIAETTDSGATWTSDDPAGISSDVFGLCYSPDLSVVAAFGFDVTTIATTEPPAPPPPPGVRFFQGYPWRWCLYTVTNWKTPALVLVTVLDALVNDWSVDLMLNDPCQIGFRVPSDNPEVYLLYDDPDSNIDTEPFVAEGRRVVIGFRREGTTPGKPWVPRAAGIIMQVSDAASNGQGAGNAYTSVTAWDPWQLLYHRPILNEGHFLPGTDGLKFFLQPANEIAASLIQWSDEFFGPSLIDLVGGTSEACPAMSITFERGDTVGDGLKRLCEAGNLDIVLEPIYEPSSGGSVQAIVRVHFYNVAGVDRPNAVFAWNKPSLNVADIERVEDGTQRANELQYYNGAGGPPVQAQIDYDSVTQFSPYYEEVDWPDLTTGDVVLAKAKEDIQVRGKGITTVTVSPLPERAPVPLIDYHLGDFCPVYAGRKGFRKSIVGFGRITKIPLRGSDTEVETVESLELTTKPPRFDS